MSVDPSIFLSPSPLSSSMTCRTATKSPINAPKRTQRPSRRPRRHHQPTDHVRVLQVRFNNPISIDNVRLYTRQSALNLRRSLASYFMDQCITDVEDASKRICRHKHTPRSASFPRPARYFDAASYRRKRRRVPAKGFYRVRSRYSMLGV